MVTMSLIRDIMLFWQGVSIRLSCDWGRWNCEIIGTTLDGEYWWCEAEGRTLPEAFCRAWVQQRDEE